MEFGLSGDFAGTLQGRINVVLPGVVNFPWFHSGTPLYLNPQARVNTILTHFLRLRTPRGIGRRETAAQRDAAACTRNGAKSARTDPHHLSPIVKILAPASVPTVSAEGWDEAWVLPQFSE